MTALRESLPPSRHYQETSYRDLQAEVLALRVVLGNLICAVDAEPIVMPRTHKTLFLAKQVLGD